MNHIVADIQKETTGYASVELDHKDLRAGIDLKIRISECHYCGTDTYKRYIKDMIATPIPKSVGESNLRYAHLRIINMPISRHFGDEHTIDHKVPKAEGGTKEDGNGVPCCSLCNQRKGRLSYEEFMLITNGDRTMNILTDEQWVVYSRKRDQEDDDINIISEPMDLDEAVKLLQKLRDDKEEDCMHYGMSTVFPNNLDT